MTTQAWIVMTQAQKEAAVLLDGNGAELGPRYVDNPMANNLGYGTLLGMWVSPARLLNDPLFVRWKPTLGTYPIHVMDSDTLFEPVADI